MDLTPIYTAVRQASSLCQRIQQTRFVRSEKAQDDPVTIADYGSQVILLRAIGRFFPDDAVLSEEQGDQFMNVLTDAQRIDVLQLLNDILDEPITQDDVVRWLDQGRGRQTERTWVVDPVDGTKGFIGLRRYSIAVGILERGQPVAGILGSPGHPSDDGLGKLFYTEGLGTFVEPMSGGPARPIRVSERGDMARVRMVESVVSQHSNLEQSAQLRALVGIPEANVEPVDSQEKYAMVASGEADLYLRLPRTAHDTHYVWDHCAGTAIVQAAGGRVTDIEGSPLDFSHGRTLARNRGMVVTNGLIHDRILAAIAEVTG